MAGAQEAKARQAKEATSGVLVFVLTALGPSRGSETGRVTIRSAFVKGHHGHSGEQVLKDGCDGKCLQQVPR